MKKGRKYKKEEIIAIAQSLIGKTFGEIKHIEVNNIDDSGITKGSLGEIIEESVYGIQSNSDSAPDFIDAGIELKVTPYKINKNKTLSAKERLVLNQIDFSTEFANEFKSSHFWYKNNKLEILWYLYENNKNKYDYKITNALFLDLELSEDLKQIEKDYDTIIKKIKDGKAHEISEGDTMYLGACTKGYNSNDLRTQPFSNIKAMRRAFCFKTSYMNQLVRKYIGKYEDIEKIITDNNKTFEEYIQSVTNKYINKTQKELFKIFNLDSKAKNINSILVSKMFGIKGKLSNTEEFLKANIVPKTIRIEENGIIKESLSFPAFKYTNIIKEEWENSELKEQLELTKYLFFIFKKENNEYVFKGMKLWNMPEEIIENEVQSVWNKTKEVIKSGNIVRSIEKNIRKTNFPGISDNKYCHVRPHAKNKDDTFPLPVVDKYTGINKYTKHCFWINNTYLKEILKEFN